MIPQEQKKLCQHTLCSFSQEIYSNKYKATGIYGVRINFLYIHYFRFYGYMLIF